MTNGNDAINAFGYGTVDFDGMPDTAFNFGLTKREYFAAIAMQGMLAGQVTVSPGDIGIASNDMGRMAVGNADALIETLNRTEVYDAK